MVLTYEIDSINSFHTRVQCYFLVLDGPDLAAKMLPGVRVVRGTDWEWGAQVQQFVSIHNNLDVISIHYSLINILH